MGKVTLSVPTNLIRRAKAKAALLGTSVSAVVREFLVVWTQETYSPDKQADEQD